MKTIQEIKIYGAAMVCFILSYEIDGKTRRINAINYFRDGISPTW